jgi:hypothetical protein
MARIRPLRGLRLAFRATGRRRYPFEAFVDGHHCLVRENDFPAELFRYSLLVDGKEVDHFSCWPLGWERSEEEPTEPGTRAAAEDDLAIAAADGDPAAQLELGRRRLREGDEAEGIRLIGLAASAGDAAAMYALGLLYGTGRAGVPKDDEHRDQWLARAAEAGHLEARLALARLGIRVAA